MTEIFERLGSRIEVTVEKTSSLSGNALRIKSLEDVLKKVFETITSNLPQRISSTISSTDIARLGLTLPYVKDPPRSADPNSITASFTLEDENTAHKTNKQLIEDFIRAKLAPAVAAR